MPDPETRKMSRIQQRNRHRILDAALEVFSQHGYRGATLDQIAAASGMSKPNILYYFEGKEAIHVALLNALMTEWLAPLHAMDANGDPVTEILNYVTRKMEMSREFPRQSRLFAKESDLKPLFMQKCAVIQGWIDAGHLPVLDPEHLVMSIWAMTQHYADFEAQVHILASDADASWERAKAHVTGMFRTLLTQPTP